jgi:CspA family cold shock protein
MRIRGTVKWFNETKGYGFLRRDDGQSDCFVHHSEIQSQGYRTLQEGERVEFDVVQQPKGPKASNVVKLDEADGGAETADSAETAAPAAETADSAETVAPAAETADSAETVAPAAETADSAETVAPAATETGDSEEISFEAESEGSDSEEE